MSKNKLKQLQKNRKAILNKLDQIPNDIDTNEHYIYNEKVQSALLLGIQKARVEWKINKVKNKLK